MNPLDALADSIHSTPVYRSTWFLPTADDAKLNHNEAAHDVDEALKQTILAAIAKAPWHRYPDAHCERLCAAFAAAWGLEPDQVRVGPGANALISRVLMSLHPQATVIVCTPGYYVYERLAIARGLDVVHVPLLARDGPTPFDLDTPAVLAAAQNVERPVVVLINPNNPTANLLSHGALTSLLARFDGLIVIDEAYQEFAGRSSLPLLAQHPGLVILRTLSKAAGLAGWRVGALAASAALAEQLDKIASPYNLSMPAQIAAEVVLQHPEHVAATAAATCAARDRLCAELRSVAGLRVFDSATNFVLIDAGANRGRALVELAKRRVTVRDLHAVAGLHGCVRVAVGSERENARVIAAFGAAVR